MADLLQAFHTAARLIVTLDPRLVEIVLLSVKVSLLAVVVASAIGFALGGALAVYRFPGRGAMAALLSALMGLPPVVAGLLVYLLLSNAGPLGVLQLLYTPTAMIIAAPADLLTVMLPPAQACVGDGPLSHEPPPPSRDRATLHVTLPDDGLEQLDDDPLQLPES